MHKKGPNDLPTFGPGTVTHPDADAPLILQQVDGLHQGSALLPEYKVAWQQLKNDLAMSLKSERVAEIVSELQSITGTGGQASSATTNVNALAGSVDIERELAKLKDLSKLVASDALSVCCYTIHHTYGRSSSVAFSRHSSQLAIGSQDSYISIWSLDNTLAKTTMKKSVELALVDYDTVPDLKDLSTPSSTSGPTCSDSTFKLIGHSGPVYALKFLGPLDRTLLSVSGDSTVRLWSLDTRLCVSVYKGHEGPIWCADVLNSPTRGSGTYFITGGWDRVARVWTTSQSAPIRLLVGHFSDVTHTLLHPNGLYALTASLDQTIRVWDIPTGTCVRLIRLTGIPTAVKLTPDGAGILIGLANEILWVDLNSGKVVYNATSSTASTNSHAISSDTIIAFAWPYGNGTSFVSISLSGTLCYYKLSLLENNSHLRLMSTFSTKNNQPLMDVLFTPRNLLLTVAVA